MLNNVVKTSLIITALVILSIGCEKENIELKKGWYVIQDSEIENYAWVLLKEGNKFEFHRNLTTSYTPLGEYKIENNILKLIVSEEEMYEFRIIDDELVYKGSSVFNSIVKGGTVFKFQDNLPEIDTSVEFCNKEIASVEIDYAYSYNSIDDLLNDVSYDLVFGEVKNVEQHSIVADAVFIKIIRTTIDGKSQDEVIKVAVPRLGYCFKEGQKWLFQVNYFDDLKQANLVLGEQSMFELKSGMFEMSDYYKETLPDNLLKEKEFLDLLFTNTET